ncbi:MAG: hypothetical protein WD423_02270 [Rhodothermales bacterium]
MPNTLMLDVSELLPELTDVHDACLFRLVSTMESHAGITAVHVLQGPAHEPEQLCIHYDPEVLSSERAVELAEGLSDALQTRFGHLSVRLASVQAACRTVDRLRETAGVRSVESAPGGWVRVEYNRDRTSEAAIREALASVGEDEMRMS